MSYRTIKRVLGETSLERKCRFFFGLSLLILIAVAFYGVDQVAERLVLETTRSKASDLVMVLISSAHYEHAQVQENPAFRALAKRLSDIFIGREVRYELLRGKDELVLRKLEKARVAEDETEQQILLELRQRYLAELAEDDEDKIENKTDPSEMIFPEQKAFFATRGVAPEELGGEEEYHYYAPIYWTADCRDCHDSVDIQGSLSVAESGFFAQPPFYAMKVMFPYKETKAAVTWVRAILIAVAILTVFLSMIALYIVVRYVIVKPLTHLRDVSEQISRGQTGLRAEINTADEFEDLASSFNRMVRHLTHTQCELEEVNFELDSRVDQLAQVNMRLYEMNRLKDDFLANMSHELRTPLNSIIGFSEVLQGIETLNDKQKRYAGNIQKSGRLLLEMINDILDVAKLEAGKMEIRPTDWSVKTIVDAQCDMVRSLTDEKNIDLEVDVPENLPPLYQDQAKVQQILTNLLSNSIKFTPEGGRIVVTARQDERERLNLTVSDTGVGIATEDRDVVFEKFRQTSNVVGEDGFTREFSGTGLGLSIVKELCKLLGGEVTFESELGKGSSFTIVLPWRVTNQPTAATELEAKLNEMSRPQSIDLRAGLPAEGDDQNANETGEDKMSSSAASSVQ